MRKGIEGFRPERLALALSVRGINQQSFADLIGKSPGTVSKWLKGPQLPEAEALQTIAEKLRLSPHWFLKPLPNLRDRAFLMRSLKSRERVARDRMESRLVLAQELAAFLYELVDFPELDVPSSSTDVHQISDGVIEDAAEKCRLVWRLGTGPVPDVMLALENAGVVVIREDAYSVKIEGASRWCTSLGRPFVYLAADKCNAYRSRFDAAHELGHLVLHRDVLPADVERLDSLLETQAHKFASAFLMPARAFAAEFPCYPTLDALLLLKRKWKASVAAIIMRGLGLGLLDEASSRRLWKARSARWGAKEEPGDRDLPCEEPRLLRRTVNLVLESGNFTREDLSDSTGISAVDIEGLAGLPRGFLTSKGAEIISIEDHRLRAARRPGSVKRD